MRYLFEDCALDADRRELRRGTDLVSVEPQVFDLLVYLICNRERVVSKDDLLASVWQGRIVSESTVGTRINAARSAIGDNGEDQRLIKTFPRKGIRFVGAVREAQQRARMVPRRAAVATAVICAGLAGVYLLARSTAPSGEGAQRGRPSGAAGVSHSSRPTFRDCDVCPEMVVIPEGFFTMGAPPSEVSLGRADHETPQRTVRFSVPFALARYEVTVDQFANFVAETGYAPVKKCSVYALELDRSAIKPATFREPPHPSSADHPATCVNWHDARAYADWLAAKTKRPYRLPSEAEWEYAARAGTTTPYAFGAFDPQAICQHAKIADASTRFAWRNEACSSDYGHGPAPVGKHHPNAWGLYDMHGNVWEGVADCWHPRYEGAPEDGSAWGAGEDCTHRPIRGGSWQNTPIQIRIARRLGARANQGAETRGFRVALSVGQL